ncbi:MAG: DHA2 family efflux MFS transporter permease subunit [Sphingomonadales bacterium]|nr:DHA2 family efflux MFS transporter permease subunit [Sphingomonadales bacterium]
MSVAHAPITPARKAAVTASVMCSTMIVALDGTIANVALPHMQSSLGASPEQVVWVLTSYLIASAIMTPLSSWLASRFGRKLVMTVSAAGFTLASLGCGLANSLEFMVFARLVQGLSGAGLIPLGQATLLDINPPEKQGQAMAMAGLGAMLGPLAGPTLGGWLTDSFTWRWVFLINIPIGLIAFAGLSLTMLETRDKGMAKFDLFGFATVSLFLGALQLVFDRGAQLDWFDSTEICIEATVAALAGYLMIVHMFTARDTFVRAALFADRNFLIGCGISAVIGLVIFATVPLLTVMTQNLLGYTALQTGLIGMPRAIGTVTGLLIVGNLIGRVDARVLLTIGLAMIAAALFMFSRISLETDRTPLLLAGLLQGFAGGLMIAPLSTLTFSTLTPLFRNEGTAIYSLFRSIGNALGISVLQLLATRNTAAVTGRLSEGVRPDNPTLQAAMPDFAFDSVEATLRISGAISRQAAMVALVDTMWLACLVAMATLPLVLLLRGKRSSPQVPVIDAGH